jgi:hypothetical protein
MNKYLVISIDVEPDCTSSWRYSNPLTFNGVQEGIKNRLQPLFNAYANPPTYLINNVVLENDASVNTLKSLEGDYELGTHLHPEFIEPQKEVYQYDGQRSDANCCFYPHEIESGKIESITNLFAKKIGYKPTSFRAGRFSAAGNTLDTLARLGYKVDTSVTPNVIWEDRTRESPVDFRNAFVQPYFARHGTILEEDKTGKLLEVPVSISNKPSSLLREMKESRFGLKRSMRKTSPMWLRPVYSSTKQFIEIVESFSKLYVHNEVLVFNMMFHNVEVMPGLSPYTQNEEQCVAYLKQIEDFFKYCQSEHIMGIKLTDVYALYRS